MMQCNSLGGGGLCTRFCQNKDIVGRGMVRIDGDCEEIGESIRTTSCVHTHAEQVRGNYHREETPVD